MSGSEEAVGQYPPLGGKLKIDKMVLTYLFMLIQVVLYVRIVLGHYKFFHQPYDNALKNEETDDLIICFFICFLYMIWILQNVEK